MKIAKTPSASVKSSKKLTKLYVRCSSGTNGPVLRRQYVQSSPPPTLIISISKPGKSTQFMPYIHITPTPHITADEQTSANVLPQTPHPHHHPQQSPPILPPPNLNRSQEEEEEEEEEEEKPLTKAPRAPHRSSNDVRHQLRSQRPRSKYVFACFTSHSLHQPSSPFALLLHNPIKWHRIGEKLTNVPADQFKNDPRNPNRKTSKPAAGGH